MKVMPGCIEYGKVVRMADVETRSKRDIVATWAARLKNEVAGGILKMPKAKEPPIGIKEGIRYIGMWGVTA